MRKWMNRVGLALTLVAFVALVALVGCRVQELGSTNFYGLDITVPTEVATATPGVVIDSAAVSAPLEVRKNATTVFQVDGSGNLTVAGDIDMEGGLDVAPWAKVVAPTSIATATPVVVVDSAGVSALIEARKNATPVFQVNGSGAIDAEGSLDVANWARIVAPTAIATATPALLVDSTGVSALMELRKAATPVFRVDGSGNATIAGSTDHQNSIYDSTDTLTVADNMIVDGAADAEQLVVQGNATQTNNPFVVEQSDGTDVLTVSNAGAVMVASTADIRGDVSDGAGTFTVADNVLIDGAADAIQLTVQGNATQTSALMAVEESGGTDVATFKQSPAADSGATVSLVEIAGANPINTAGTQTLEGLTIDLSVGDSSGGTNVVRGIGIDGITGDAEVIEEAISIGGGYDIDLSAATDGLDMGVGSTIAAVVDSFDAADSGTTSQLLEVLGTTPIDTTGTNVHNGIVVDLAIGNASGGTNSAVGVQIDGITGDAEVTETAINVGAGWDTDIVTAGNVQVGGTSDLVGNVGDSGGTFTVADDMAITGQADTVQLTVTGYTTQTEKILVVQDVGTSSLFSVGGTGNTYVAGALDVRGEVTDGVNDATPLVLADSVSITGNTVDISGALQIPTNKAHIGTMAVATKDITYTSAAGGSGVVMWMGDSTLYLIHDVFIVTGSGFSATGDDATLIVGDDLDTDGFLAVADAGLQETYSASTGWATGAYGLKDGEQGAYVADGSGFLYVNSSGNQSIDWVLDEIDGETLTAGQATIYVVYTRIQ